MYTYFLYPIAVHKIDLTAFQSKRFVLLSSNSDEEYRGYVSESYKTSTTFNIGRTSDTGTGHIGDEVVNPDPGILPSDSGFTYGTTAGYSSESTFRRINIKIEGENQAKGRVGAFYVKAVDNSGQAVQITTIKTAEEGKKEH